MLNVWSPSEQTSENLGGFIFDCFGLQCYAMGWKRKKVIDGNYIYDKLGSSFIDLICTGYTH